MLTHAQVWTAIDRLAERYALSASGLAKRAGLDAAQLGPHRAVPQHPQREQARVESEPG